MTGRKKITVAVFVLAMLPILLAIFLYGCGWFYRLQAEKMLLVVKEMKPGVTSQAEYMKAMTPVTHFAEKISEWDSNGKPAGVRAGAYVIWSHPLWVYKPLWFWSPWMSDRILIFMDHWTLLDGPMFTVEPEFKGGVLASLLIREWQHNVHPLGASVMWYGAMSERPPWVPFNGEFNGYFLYQRHTETGVWSSTIVLDNRATDEERRRALDFRFECFTDLRSCMDGSKVLQPAPNRPGTDDNP